jgi:hypothetical protein
MKLDPELAEDIKPVAPESRNSMDFQHFLLLEMPQIFRQTAEVHAGRRIEDHESLAMESISFVITEAINKAFQQWESSGHSVPRHLSPSSFVPESSVNTSPSLPIDTPIMASFVSEPTTYASFSAQVTMDDFWPAQDPAIGFPLEMARLPSHGDDSGFVEQQPTFPPGANGYNFQMPGFDSGYGHGAEYGCQPWL